MDVDNKYCAALAIIRETNGHLSDDTYLEKLSTETSKRLSAGDVELWTNRWGLEPFVTDMLLQDGLSICSPAQVFALDLLIR